MSLEYGTEFEKQNFAGIQSWSPPSLFSSDPKSQMHSLPSPAVVDTDSVEFLHPENILI